MAGRDDPRLLSRFGPRVRTFDVEAALQRTMARLERRHVLKEHRWSRVQRLVLAVHCEGVQVRISTGDGDTDTTYPNLDAALGAVMDWFWPEEA